MKLDPIDLARAVLTLDAADMSRGPAGMNEDDLTTAGGMRAHLRLALGHEKAVLLHRGGHAGWWMGSLVGHNIKPGDTATVIDAGEDAAVLVAISHIAQWSRFGSPFLDATSLERAIYGRVGERRISSLPDWVEEHLDANDDVVVRRRSAIRHLCDLAGIGSPDEPMDMAGLWTEHFLDATVVSVKKTNGDWQDVLVDTDDNRRRTLRWKDFEGTIAWMRAPWDKPRVGERLRIDFSGRTPEHDGHVSRIHDLKNIEDAQRRKAWLEIMARPKLVAAYEDGTNVALNDRVELDTSCLEATRGTRGRVIEICGDLAMVRFTGRRRPVPCYGHALSKIGANHRESIAA